MRSLTRGRLEAMLDSLPVGIVAVDRAACVEFQNSEASRVLGVSARTTRGGPLARHLGPQHPAVSLLAEVLETHRQLASHACELPTRIGTEPLIADLSASPLGVDDGLDGAVLTLRDRTIGRQLEAMVDQRSRSEQFAKLAAGIAHEVRNPLSGIRGAAELLLGKVHDPNLLRYPALIRDETDRIRRLLDDLAELTSTRELALCKTNVHRVVDDLLELQRQAAEWEQIEVVREYDPSIPEIEADPDRLSQILLNLLRNAVQAMQGKGRLVVRTRVESPSQRPPGEERPVGMVRIDIEDNGPGIADEDLPHIFTPFFTRSEQGNGLGLPIAQHWTLRHGGRIQVSDAPDRGARMRVLLPVRRDP